MNKEDIKELQEYNLKYLEAINSEEIFGGDYTSAVELEYVKKEHIDTIRRNEDKQSRIEKAVEYIKEYYIFEDDGICYKKYDFDATDMKKVVDILQGEDE